MMDNLISLTQKLISLRSDYPTSNEQKVGNFLVIFLKKHGFKVELQYSKDSDQRFNILASRGSGKKSVLFYGHQDTVPLFDEKMWIHPPFSGKVDGDKLYGLGAYDMKGGIAAFLQTVQHVDGYLKIFMPYDEENISEGAWLAIQDRPEFFADVELVLSPEPNFGLGINNIPTSRPGRSVYEVILKANAAHVAEYLLGGDAVVDMAEFITAFHRTFHDQTNKFFHSKYSLAMIRKVFSESVGITAPSEAFLQIEVYLDKSDSEEDFLATLKSLTSATIKLIPRKTPYLKAYRFDEFPHQELIKKIIKKHTGKDFTNHTYSAVGDDNVVATMGAPVLTWGPDGANAHIANEYVSISSLETLTEMFIELLNQIKE